VALSLALWPPRADGHQDHYRYCGPSAMIPCMRIFSHQRAGEQGATRSGWLLALARAAPFRRKGQRVGPRRARCTEAGTSKNRGVRVRTLCVIAPRPDQVTDLRGG